MVNAARNVFVQLNMIQCVLKMEKLIIIPAFYNVPTKYLSIMANVKIMTLNLFKRGIPFREI